MIYEQRLDNPFRVQISFHKLIESLEEIALSDVDYRSNYAKGLLNEVNKFPELRDGITDITAIQEHKQLIRYLLSDLFPTALTKNEIKAVAIPFHNIVFNYSERFQNILNNAGPDFDMTIRDFDDHEFYVMSCCLILVQYYGLKIDFSKPFFYDIPDAEGIIKHYRILYNADFMEILPTEKAIPITQEDIDILIDNYDNFEMWKEKFPTDSWILKGFGIMSMYDATTESAVSNLKTSLISKREDDFSVEENFEAIFRSIYRIPDLKIGYTAINYEENKFVTAPFDKNVQSFILSEALENDCKELICDKSFDGLIKKNNYLSISDVEKFANENPENKLALQFVKMGIKSAIFAPMVKGDKLLGIIELVSSQKGTLNSINAHKMDIVMPYIIDTMDRFYFETENEIEAIIQKEYTAIHPSVYWKFREEAMSHIGNKNTRDLPFKEIVFKNITPLYGQIDIKGSSTARNLAIEKDLALQIDLLIDLFKFISENLQLPVIYQNIFELEKYQTQLKESLKADTESIVQTYILNEIHPILQHFNSSNRQVQEKITAYFEVLDPHIQMVYHARKDFDNTLSLINKKMASVLDKKQEKAQEFYPHYYERFKTDGVEHNLYIGASISPKNPYNPLYLSNLRLWQLQAICEMENEYFHLRKTLPYDLDVTSLILVFSTPISIRFRMDEKRFDVDGTYNARYEVVKKRIDKSNIKGTQERITQRGKITIVYSQHQEEMEYRKYIQLLQHKNLLGAEIENFEVEDLQGVTGLRALRVEVVYNEIVAEEYTYQELVKDFK
ncbi:hypothetical protein J2X31_001724 [Flavobacterium arsenatis]|uniref:GAF domain-containing protein n=1 Tax=Flavobacterium arsenatis TaxID=1484332 RepID=A0ABU1TP10_9FLAO|nr:GAF domain-containing protein [Flavobacterium arsenatis]MDR6967712.1 hypothetical protein [Flavobacterium arsenatis]